MKVFSAYQPFAFSIVAGIKPHETRSRRTNIRGRVAVHAGKRPFNGGNVEERLKREIAYGEVQKAEYAERGEAGLFRAAELAFGAVIGTVEIVDCVPVEEVVNTLTDRERLLGDYSPGRFAWVLKNPVMFENPIPARGQQGWWEWNEWEACKATPDDIIRDLQKVHDMAYSRGEPK